MVICPHCQMVNPETSMACASCGAPLSADTGFAADPYVGRTLGGRFLLEAIVGSGEVGMVYRGLDQRTGQEVAVKIVHPDVAATHGTVLLKSARVVASLRHAKLAMVLGAAREADGTTFIVSEFLHGQTLKSLLQGTGPLGPRRAADILFQLCSALAPLHRAGRPHANLKPENVFLSEKADGGDAVKLCDAGAPDLFGVRETSQGRVVIGSPKYFSPEQASGQIVAENSDQFVLGIIGYQLLSGALPFFGATPDQLLTAISLGTPTPIAQRISGHVSSKLCEVIDTCLQKTPSARYPGLRALATDLATVIKSTQRAAPAPKKRGGFGAGLDLSTRIAGTDLLEALAEAEESDDEATQLFQAPDEATPAVEALGYSSEAAALHDLSKVPEPLMFTGALNGDELSAAIAQAAASMGHDAPQHAPMPVPLDPTPAPVSHAPAPMKSLNFGGDLASALADAAADVGAPAPQAPAFSAPQAPAFQAPPPPPPRAPAGGLLMPPEAGTPVARPVSTPPAPELGASIFGDLDDLDHGAGSINRMAAASPLATAADFTALSPVRSTSESAAITPRKAVGRRRGGNRTRLMALALVLVASGGFGVWYFMVRADTTAPQAIRGTPRAKKKPATQPAKATEALKVRLVSVPAGARVFEGDKALGLAPVELTFDSAEARVFTLKLADYGDTEKRIVPADLPMQDEAIVVEVGLHPLGVAEPKAPGETGETPAAGTPKKPVPKNPAAKKPVRKKPVRKKPVRKKPVRKKPVRKKPTRPKKPKPDPSALVSPY